MKSTFSIIIISVLLTINLNSQSLEWVKTFGGISGNYGESGTSVAIDADGNVYTVGLFAETVDFNPNSSDEYSLTSEDELDLFIQKLDNEGNFIWAKSFGGSDDDEAVSIAISTEGNLYITGNFSETIIFDEEIISSVGGKDFFILKLNLEGEFQWVRIIGGIQHEIARSLTIDYSGDIIVTGFFGGLVDFDPSDSVFNLDCENTEDVFVLKLNSSGDFLWAQKYGESSRNEGKGIITDESGAIYICGAYSMESLYTTINNGDTTSYNSSSSQVLVMKLNENGDVEWLKTSLSEPIIDEYPGDSKGYGIGIDSQGNVFVTGVYEKSVDFDSGNTLSTQGTKGFFVEKFDSQGSFLWVQGLNGDENSFNLGQSILVDTNDNVLMSGMFNGGVDFGDGVIEGGFDAFIQKIDGNGNLLWYKVYASSLLNICIDIVGDEIGNIYSTGSFGGSVNFGTNENEVYESSIDSWDSFVIKIKDDDFVSVDELTIQNLFLYPNPSNGLFTIEFPSTMLEKNNSTILISDFSGKIIYQDNFQNHTNSLDLQFLSNGIYILSVLDENERMYRKKLIIQD